LSNVQKKENSSHSEDIEQQIIKIIDSMYWILEAHDSTAELTEVKGNRVFIQISGQCAECDTNCIEDALYAELPDIELIFM
jgi:Fe-S cluster biogenesis protein NfuA